MNKINKKEPFRIFCAVFLILEHNNKILFIRRANTGYHDGRYALPAGHLEAHEGPKQALIREAKEEIGIDITMKNLTEPYTQYRHCPDREYIDFFFVVDTWSGEITNNEPEKCDQITWFPKDTLPENLPLYTKQAITALYQQIHYQEIKDTDR